MERKSKMGSGLALSGANAPALPKGEPLAKPKTLPHCQSLSLWERWHRVSDDGEGEDDCVKSDKLLIDRRFCPSHADDGGADLFPAAAAAHTIYMQARAPLEAFQRFLRPGTEDAVDAAPGLVAQRGKRVL